MPFNKKNTGLVVAGLAAYAYYKYTRLSDVEKQELSEKWKGKAKKIYDDYVPSTVKDLFEKRAENGTTAQEAPSYSF